MNPILKNHKTALRSSIPKFSLPMAPKINKSRNLKIHAGAFYIPKGTPERPLGDDAHFFCQAAQVIGVADGVGGCAKKGIDPGEYARELMSHAAHTVEGLRPAEVDHMNVLMEAYLKTKAAGNCTACIISVAEGRLRAANLGDSGFLVVRGAKTVYKSQPQVHRFNCPYQLKAGGKGNSPDDADELVVALAEGDVIVAGTDGLFDNLFTYDIEAVVNPCLKEGDGPEVMAWKIAKAAHRRSKRKNVASPFQMACSEAGVEHFGGKTDDITVVIAYIV